VTKVVIGLSVAVMFAFAACGWNWWFHDRTDPLQRVEQSIEQGNARAALIDLHAAMVVKSRDPGPHLRLAAVLMKLADPVTADREYRLALSLGADRWVVTPLLAEALLAEGLNEEVLRRTPQTGPAPDIALRNLYARSVAQLELGDLAAAAATLAQVRRVGPDSIEVPLIAARIAAARGENQQAEDALETVLRRAPRLLDAVLLKEQLAALRGDHAEALNEAGLAVDVAPWSLVARIRRATELIYAGKDDQAQADVDAVLNLQPRFIDAIYLTGILEARRGQDRDAAVAFEQLDPVLGRFPQALYYKALVAAKLGQIETAVSYARRYNALVPGDPDGVRLVARADMAAGTPDHAVPILEASIAAGSKDTQMFDLLGSAQGNLGNPVAAIDAFQRALALAPDDPVIRTHLGLAQIQSGAVPQAFGTLTMAADNPLAPPAAQEALVSVAIADGDLASARAALSRFRAQAGETEQAGILAGMIEVRRHDLSAAQAAFADTLRRFPTSLPARLAYAKVLLQQGRRLDAMDAMAEILAHDPANVAALKVYLPLLVQNRQLGRLVAVLGAAHAANPRQAGFTATLADALVLSGDARKAVSMLRAVGDSGPLPPVLLAALARAQASASAAGLPVGMAAEAGANFREVLRMIPNDAVDRIAYIDMLLRDHDTETARAQLEAGLALAPQNFRFMSTLVELEAQTKGLDAGLRLADTLRADPARQPDARLLKGDALMRARRYNSAVRAFLDEYETAPALPLLLRAAAAHVAAGQEAAATRLLQGWLAHDPNAPEALQDLAKLDLRASRLDQARAHLEALLALQPDDATALNNLAVTYLLQGDPRARATAQQAYLQGGGPDAADTLGWIMVQQGEAAAALPLLRQAASMAPGDAGIRYHLAAALSAVGRPAEAIPVLQTLLEPAERFADRPAAAKLLADLSR
jgi:putative PEP-CTERM system TPR-repeat lipoprotein